MKEDRCVYCGDVIPEGRQVCPNCERMVGMGKPRMCGAFAPYTPNNKQDLRYRRKAAKTATIPGRCKDCAYWSRNEIKDKEFGVCFNIRGVSVIKREDGFCDKWRANNEL